MFGQRFESVPSSFETYDYPKCGEYTISKATVFLNLAVIRDHGINRLQDAITNTRAHPCLKCGSPCAFQVVYNNHVFIEMDLRYSHSVAAKTYKLSDFPSKLQLGYNYR